MGAALRKPRSIHPGDKIGIVAPASPISRDLLQGGCARVEAMGFRPVFSESIFAEEMYFAGSHEHRAQELQRMFLDPEIKAIICARGGYGTNHLLPLLDVKSIGENPKIFVGYSDITTLLTHFLDTAGFVTFHGPMITKDFARLGGVDTESFLSVLAGENCRFPPDGASVLREGSAEGKLYGGCLSMLAASLGTPYEIQTADSVLFIEDIATKPYQIDRMLMQLRYAGKFDAVQGIIFGEMLDCAQSAEQGYTLQDVIRRTLAGLEIPMLYGFRSGHVSTGNVTLPLGTTVSLNARADGIDFQTTEAATAD